jgi:uncharacterized membrane protein
MDRPCKKGLVLALNGLSKVSLNKQRLRRIAVVICALIVAGYVLYPLLAPLEKADLIGYSICHRIPNRSFHYGGRQLPLCARCTGTYLGIVIGFVALAVLRRWRAGEMLRTGWIVLMVSFIGIMGVDGLNSYLSLFPSMPHLYEPQNWLRALTGSLNGIALTMIVWPVFNFTLWKRPQPARPFRNGWELAGILLVDLGVVTIVQAEPAWLLYPMALLSAGGVLWMLALVNTMILLILFRLDSQAETWRDAVPPLLGGLTVTLLELTAIGTLRYLLTGTMSWPLA